jgi:hypothetical protein
MAEQKLDLFEFASTSMAEARAAATKIVRCQIAHAGLLGATFDRGSTRGRQLAALPRHYGRYQTWAAVPLQS